MAKPNPGAGSLSHRVRLERRGIVDDGYGNMVPGGEFEPVDTVWADLVPMRGGEAVIASRLEGRQPYTLTIRQSSISRPVDETWRVVDARNEDRVFAVIGPKIDPYERRGAFFDIPLVEGAPS